MSSRRQKRILKRSLPIRFNYLIETIDVMRMFFILLGRHSHDVSDCLEIIYKSLEALGRIISNFIPLINKNFGEYGLWVCNNIIGILNMIVDTIRKNCLYMLKIIGYMHILALISYNELMPRLRNIVAIYYDTLKREKVSFFYEETCL